jgi:hypothetical protein
MQKEKSEKSDQAQRLRTYNFDFLTPDRIGIVQRQADRLLAELDHAPASRGRTYLQKHYAQHIVLTPGQAILAHCADCCGYYVDKKHDCEVEWCVFYRYMPYGKIRKHKKRSTMGQPVALEEQRSGECEF